MDIQHQILKMQNENFLHFLEERLNDEMLDSKDALLLICSELNLDSYEFIQD